MCPYDIRAGGGGGGGGGSIGPQSSSAFARTSKKSFQPQITQLVIIGSYTFNKEVQSRAKGDVEGLGSGQYA